MTNGEKLQETFPDIEIVAIVPEEIIVIRKLDDTTAYSRISFRYEWWYAEYKEPTTKNNLGVDCISRDAVLKPYEGLKDEDTISVWLIRKNIEQQPFVKQEPRKGHWIDTDEWRETVDGFEQWGYFRKCSKCGYVFKFLEIDNYCPNCGADMREVKE